MPVISGELVLGTPLWADWPACGRPGAARPGPWWARPWASIANGAGL